MKKSEIKVGHIYSSKNGKRFRWVQDCTWPGECSESYLFVCDANKKGSDFTYGSPYHILRSSFAKWAKDDEGRHGKVGYELV